MFRRGKVSRALTSSGLRYMGDVGEGDFAGLCLVAGSKMQMQLESAVLLCRRLGGALPQYSHPPDARPPCMEPLVAHLPLPPWRRPRRCFSVGAWCLISSRGREGTGVE